jgi:hypothetical protein
MARGKRSSTENRSTPGAATRVRRCRPVGGFEGGALVKDDRVPDIITKDQYGDFELELEWKIGEAGNSGIFYRGIEDPGLQRRVEQRPDLHHRPGIPAAR